MRPCLCCVTIAALLGAGCEGGNPVNPGPLISPLPSTPPPPPPPAGSALLGALWEGLSVVEAIAGDAPSCIAPFWRPASSDTVSAEIRLAPPGLDMTLHQPASENCHVQITEGPGSIKGGPWPYDEFDCALVPSLCGLGCHFRLSTTGWNCSDTTPEVWILGAYLDASLSGELSERMQGTMTIEYDHRAANFPTTGGGWRRMAVRTRFDLHRVPASLTAASFGLIKPDASGR